MVRNHKAKTVKSCDFSADIAVEVFKMLNEGKVNVKNTYSADGIVILTDFDPDSLVYPEGWYYANGTFRNKHMSSTGVYQQRYMFRNNGKSWDCYANYTTI